jgi:hypothetical protein
VNVRHEQANDAQDVVEMFSVSRQSGQTTNNERQAYRMTHQNQVFLQAR